MEVPSLRKEAASVELAACTLCYRVLLATGLSQHILKLNSIDCLRAEWNRDLSVRDSVACRADVQPTAGPPGIFVAVRMAF